MHGRLILLAVAASALAAAAAGVALADGPEPGMSQPGFANVDNDNRLVLFLNTTRAKMCASYAQDGVIDDVGIVQVTSRAVVLPTESIVYREYAGSVPMELWTFDTGVFESGAFVDECADTDGDARLFATGTTSLVYHDNNLTGIGARSSTWQDSGNGEVTLVADGSRWSYTFRIQRVAHPDGTFQLMSRRFQLRPLT